MKRAAIPVELFNRIVEYLGNRPYNEVSAAIEEIRQTTQIVDIEEEEQNED